MITWKKTQLHALKIASGNLKQAKTGKPKRRTWRVTVLMFQHSPWPRCKERGMLYVQAVSFLAVEKGLLFPWQTGNIFGPELIRIYSIRRIFNFCCAASDVLPSWRNLWISGPSLKASTQDSPRDTAGVHARHRKSPRETPDGKSSSPQKKPYVFNLVFELYINFSELYIKFPGKFRDFRGNRTGSRGKVCERENTPLNSTRLTDSTKKTIQNI